MAKYSFVKGETSVILIVFIRDSSQTDGRGLGSLIHTSSIVGGYVKRNGTGVALAVDEDVSTEGTYQAPSTAAHVRIGTPANMRTGTYELHFHNDLFSTADYVTITLGGATNMAPLNLEIQLTDFDLNDATPNVTVSDIAANAITAASINSAAFTTAKFAADFLTNALIADNALNSEQFNDNFLTAAKINADAITNAKIADNALDTEQFADAALTLAKLDSDLNISLKDQLFNPDFIYVDDTDGTASTVWPYGHPKYPTNTIANGKIIADANNIPRLFLRGGFTLAAAMEGYNFFGNGNYDSGDIFAVAGFSIARSTFKSIIISGATGNAAGTNDQTRYLDCYCLNHTNINGALLEGAVDGNCSIVDTGNFWARNC
jgi:hypothetical protein